MSLLAEPAPAARRERPCPAPRALRAGGALRREARGREPTAARGIPNPARLPCHYQTSSR